MSYNDLRKGRASLAGQVYLLTTVTRARQPLFNDTATGRIVVAEMRAMHESGDLRSLAFVVMPDHVHWLVELDGKRPLSACMHAFKGRSARRINDWLHRHGPVWQPAFHDHALRREEDLHAVARYIVRNPVRAGLVACTADYPLWDAIWVPDTPQVGP